MSKLSKPLIVYLPDTRGVELGRYGIGNLKIGLGVYTYSRNAGKYEGGTCPGSSDECERICYAKRIQGVLKQQVYSVNSLTDEVPPIPEGAEVLRLHISGDFDSVTYIENWRYRLLERPEVTAWVYTRSWRVPELLPALEALRALPNIQMFASMDKTVPELPPSGWRRAWIDGDERAGKPVLMLAHGNEVISKHNFVTFDGRRSYLCPEETNRKPNCLACGYCFEGQKNDVTFLEH